jgi:DNA-binding response OmpR family regulator
MEDKENVEDRETSDILADLKKQEAKVKLEAKNEPEAKSEPDILKKKLIYVDDTQFSLLSVKDRLKHRYEVYLSQSVDKLFEILANTYPDVILMDVNMPGIDGFEGIKRLKADDRYKDIPVVFLTAQNDEKSVARGMGLGASAYVGKPFTTYALVDEIENVFTPNKRRSPFEEFQQDEGDANKLCVLAIDDVHIMLRTIQSALRDKYNVYLLKNPEDIRGLLQIITPDLILLDNNMPGLSGFDIVPIIREFPKHVDTPIIFVTADRSPETMQAATDIGACDFIVKPIQISELRDKVAKHIREPETEPEAEPETDAQVEKSDKVTEEKPEHSGASGQTQQDGAASTQEK